MFTPEEARQKACPIARTFAEPHMVDPKCRGDACILWRWVPIMADDPRVKDAISRELKRLGGGAARHKEAVANVMADRTAHGVPNGPERGYCGLGGAA